jgi:hypothetical protein
MKDDRKRLRSSFHVLPQFSRRRATTELSPAIYRGVDPRANNSVAAATAETAAIHYCRCLLEQDG